MSANPVNTPSSASPSRVNTGAQVDVGEIKTYVSHGFDRPIARPELLPEETALSLPAKCATPSALDALTRFLGPTLSTASLAWGADPVPRMRALQKTLVERSLALDAEQRGPCLKAIGIIDHAVKLRLRFQQMRMEEMEMTLKADREKANEKQNKAQ